MRLKPYQEKEYVALAEPEVIERARKKLLGFTLYTKDDYEIGWHHKILCRYLDEFVQGLHPRLMVFMPPRHGKSELVSRRLPAFIFGQNPNAHIISTSYGGSLASRMNRDVQRIMESEPYADLFPESVLASSRKAKKVRTGSFFEVSGGTGSYRSAGVGGGITGMGGNFIIIDDPVKNQEEAESETYREKTWDWYTSTLYTRLEKDGNILLTMTRWHEDDLAGRLLEEMKRNPTADKWEIVCFPAIKAEDHILLHPEDKRKPGQALWPNKYSEKRLAGIKGSIGTKYWDALYDQNPSTAGGNLFKRIWWKRYRELPPVILRKGIFIDCAEKPGSSNDYTVMATWVKTHAGLYLTRLLRERMTYPEIKSAVKDLYNAERPDVLVIEDKAHGVALIQDLRNETTWPVIAYQPEDSKKTRASRAQPTVESGNCFLPEESEQVQVEDFIKEHSQFPNGAHDDQVDTTSMMVDYFRTEVVEAEPEIRRL